MRTGRAGIIVGAGAALTAPVAATETATAGPTDDSPTLAEQRHIRDQHREAESQSQPLPPAARAPTPAPAPTSVPPQPPPPAPELEVDPSHVRGSDGLTPGQRRHIRADTPAVAPTPPPAPEPEPEPEVDPSPQVDPSHMRGPDRLTPGQRRQIQTEARNQAATPPPTPPTPPPTPTPDPSQVRGPDGLTPAQRNLIGAEERAAESQPPPLDSMTPVQRNIVERERRADAAQSPPVEAEGTAMNWNLGRGKTYHPGEGTDTDELDDVAAAIADQQPDIVTLQEVYLDYDVSFGVGDREDENDVEAIIRLIEEETGVTYHAAPGPATVKQDIDDGWLRVRRGDFGNVVLSRQPIYDEVVHTLPDDGDEGRVVHELTTTVDGVEVTIFNTHMTTHGRRRPPQLEDAFSHAADPSGPVIFAGDFNVDYEGSDPYARDEGFTRITKRDGVECDGEEDTQIDHVYGSAGVTGRQRPGFDCGPSDHPYQVVDLAIRDD